MASKGRTKVFPHLWYAKEAEAAAKFYASIFPDSRVDRVTPLLSESPSGPPGSVKIVDFTLLGQRFQAMTARKMPVSPRTLRRRRATLNSPSNTDAIKTACSAPRKSGTG